MAQEKVPFFFLHFAVLPKYEGSIKLNGRELAELNTRERLNRSLIFPTSHIPAFNFSCLEVVLMATQSNGSIFYVPDEKAEETPTKH